MSKKLTKAELKNIINKDWDKRREKNKIKAEKGSIMTKKWKNNEKNIKFLLDCVQSVKKRRPNYITSPDS